MADKQNNAKSLTFWLLCLETLSYTQPVFFNTTKFKLSTYKQINIQHNNQKG